MTWIRKQNDSCDWSEPADREISNHLRAVLHWYGCLQIISAMFCQKAKAFINFKTAQKSKSSKQHQEALRAEVLYKGKAKQSIILNMLVPNRRSTKFKIKKSVSKTKWTVLPSITPLCYFWINQCRFDFFPFHELRLLTRQWSVISRVQELEATL